jgi:hypothetical protein
MWVWGENRRRIRSWGMLSGSQHFGGRGACWSSGMGLGRLTISLFIHTNLHKPNNSWLVHNLNIFGVRMNHRQTWTQKTHHGPDWGEATTFPFIVYHVSGHGTSTQMAFCPTTRKWESQNSQSWDSRDFGAHNYREINCVDLWLRWGLKQSFSSHRDLSKGMSHATYTQRN